MEIEEVEELIDFLKNPKKFQKQSSSPYSFNMPFTLAPEENTCTFTWDWVEIDHDQIKKK